MDLCPETAGDLGRCRRSSCPPPRPGRGPLPARRPSRTSRIGPIVRASSRAGRHTETLTSRCAASRSGGNSVCVNVLLACQDRARRDIALESMTATAVVRATSAIPVPAADVHRLRRRGRYDPEPSEGAGIRCCIELPRNPVHRLSVSGVKPRPLARLARSTAARLARPEREPCFTRARAQNWNLDGQARRPICQGRSQDMKAVLSLARLQAAVGRVRAQRAGLVGGDARARAPRLPAHRQRARLDGLLPQLPVLAGARLAIRGRARRPELARAGCCRCCTRSRPSCSRRSRG